MSLKNRRLSWQQPIQAKLSRRLVYTEQELLAALADLRGKVNDPTVDNGLFLQLVGPFIPMGARTLVLDFPVTIAGLAILSGSAAPIIRVTSSFVRLQNVSLTQTGTTPTCIDYSHATALTGVALDDVTLSAALATSGALVTTSSGTVTGLFTKVRRGTTGAAVRQFLGSFTSAQFNNCASGGTTGFELEGAKNVIAMNVMGGAAIDTSDSAGNNSISLNTNCGAITRHVSDHVVGNT